MARVLVVGAGSCRALSLTRELVAEGHAVRAVTRDPQGRGPELEGAGAEVWPGDPDVVGTLRLALDNVTLLLWLLGHVATPELHGSRLAMMLERTIDTTVRGIVYEAGPPAPQEGLRTMDRIAAFNEIPFRVVPLGTPLRPAVDALLAR